MGTLVSKLFALLCVFLLYRTSPSIQAEKHSLYYIYTGLSKPVDLPGIHQFTAMGLLDDRQIDYYNSEEQVTIPKQHWMKEKMEKNYWEKGTKMRKKKQWIYGNIDSLMELMMQNESDLHVLQWRHGCEVEQQGDETKNIDQYCYDGENFMSFDDRESQWVASVNTDLLTKQKWDNVLILRQNSGYVDIECVDWLNKFREYEDEELRKASPPDVHVFARKCNNETKLTCLATGFYAKDVTLFIRKYHTSLPKNEVKSSGIRPNHDDTFQIKNSVEISEDEKAEYDCCLFHRTLTEPIIIKWDGKFQDCSPDSVTVKIAAGIGGLLLLAFVALVVYLIITKGIIGKDTGRETLGSSTTNSEEHILQKNATSSGDESTDEYLQRKLHQKPKEQSF